MLSDDDDMFNLFPCIGFDILAFLSPFHSHWVNFVLQMFPFVWHGGGGYIGISQGLAVLRMEGKCLRNVPLVVIVTRWMYQTSVLKETSSQKFDLNFQVFGSLINFLLKIQLGSSLH